jgi:sulfite reductase (NADPH) flavoprotein alpha-component
MTAVHPASLATPIIMVGPGTGLAPFRSFIAHRELQLAAAEDAAAARGAAGEAVLYFGCRHEAKDYLYGTALEAWAAAGRLTLHTAFSRDGPAKVYVQQRVAESADALFAALAAGAHFYVCGDANHMAVRNFAQHSPNAGCLCCAALRCADCPARTQGDVDKALRALLAERLEGGEAAAAAFVAELEASGRYQRDVWFS